MKVEELIIDGFKSYATRTVISDWDPQFNAITGLNGSGKSNILDAICFVLGISSMATVRASNLQDLIYKRGQAGVTKASVTIVFDNTDKSNTPIGFSEYPKISVTRQIVLGGTSKYLINGHRAPQQSVLQLFQSVQLNINNPNFLIMQGKITKILNMKPSEILSLIEEAAGTKMFEDRKEKAERTMQKKETKLQENRTLLKEEIDPQLEKLRNEKRLFLEFQTIQADLETTEKVVIATDYQKMLNSRDSIKTVLETSNSKMDELQKKIDLVNREISNLNEDLQQTMKQKKKELENDTNIKAMESKEDKLLSEIAKLKANLKINGDNILDGKQKQKRLTVKIEKSKQLLDSKSQLLEDSKSKSRNCEADLTRLNSIFKQKEELLSVLSTGISSTGGTEGGYEAQISSVNDKINDNSIEIEKNKMKIELLKKEFMENEEKIGKSQLQVETHMKERKQLTEICKKLEEDIFSHGFRPEAFKELKNREYELDQAIYKTNRDCEGLRRRVAGIEFQYSKPFESFDPNSVKGVTAELFSIPEQNMKYVIGLQICAGGRLYNVIVDNEKTGSALLQKGRLRKRVTIIPLDKVISRPLNQNKLKLAKQLAPGKVELALNLIGYSDEVVKAMEFIFGNSLICDDAETAKKITFNPGIRTRSITLEGDIYDPEGTLSGGTRNNTNTLLVDIQKYNTLKKELLAMNEEKQNIHKQLKILEAKSNETSNLQKELSLKKHRLDILERTMNSEPSLMMQNRNGEIENEVKTLEDSTKQKMLENSSLQAEIEKLRKDMVDFSKNKGAKLKELKAEVHELNEQIKDLESESEKLNDTYEKIKVETEQIANEIDTDTKSLDSTVQDIEKKLEEEIKINKMLKTSEEELMSVQNDLNVERKRISNIDDELEELERTIKQKEESKNTYELELKQLHHDLSKYKNSTDGIEKALNDIQEEHEWVTDEMLVRSICEQNAGVNVNEYRHRMEQLQKNFDELRRKVNPNIMNMIESVEKKGEALKTMIRTIEKDKKKIEDTISKLNEYKKETLVKTWKKVTKDFGNIFCDLLPNSSAKLVPCEGKDITEGLEVKVKLGNLWKESLVELSGGQRSLIALSLIMALLQFRPAPMYILDEVDAALDLSHTQNIGHLIKTRFKGSQFIVVSLKEGMFTNANRVFRTRFQDGTSVVSIM
ncbi:Structural maintenance of chromosomes protein 2 [Nakaseomyces glabratus]|uniref:Structural maintenance of chromosomes protein n=1 Tax=Candida glabrata TaxID=5478 RepID=A0A0W0CM13_CANGB|nr:Structural maintenance of chromosomes protein 2 [Nakaseomyces glabratus]KTB00666.1 Structural maintenance of chromosomes protein 2 [Nakaseomyces glabratus]KTB03253.1 Structural maintenance of chromosomes protein 2 [Nakaseomyces glabratus]KTB12751.1 Structural maintenance of chromosomes protein 2 [Nakaseomyces glabratus]